MSKNAAFNCLMQVLAFGGEEKHCQRLNFPTTNSKYPTQFN